MSRKALIERVVRELASYERPSASDGRAPRRGLAGGRAPRRGLPRVRVEEERAHGGYWWPLGLLNAASALAALLGRRAGRARGRRGGCRGLRRRERRAAVVSPPYAARIGRPGTSSPRPATRTATRTVVFIAHHDAAHSGLVFHPALPRIGMRLAPKLHERANQSIPIIFGIFLGPLLLALWGLLGRRWLQGPG